jgi:hypothetical protein
MIKIIIFMLFFINFTFGQSCKNIKNIDTLYILFKGSKFESLSERTINDTITTKRFSFYKTNYNDKLPLITFLFPKVNKIDSSIKSEIKFVDKLFIKKNKRKIINYKFFLLEKNINNAIFNNNSNTIYYIIDLSNKDKKMYLVSPIIMRVKNSIE